MQTEGKEGAMIVAMDTIFSQALSVESLSSRIVCRCECPFAKLCDLRGHLCFE